jgi:radical SAM superfamily enzyme YgiQ (UPF0313 family)
VDAVCRGEGEETLLELVQRVRAGDGVAEVAGITWRGGRNPDRNRIRDVDDIPAPAWDLTPLTNFFTHGFSHGVTREPTMPILATRGCPYSCSFCSNPNMWGTRWTPRDPGAVVDEMVAAAEQYGLSNFDLYDLTTIVDRKWTLAFGQTILDRGLNITYQLASGTRCEAIDTEVAALLRASGCTHVTVAPESGSPDSIVRANKKVDLDAFQVSLKAMLDANITVSMNLIIFPDDTPQDIVKTVQFALKCARMGVQDSTFFPYMPYPGTALYDQLMAEGRLPPLSEAFFVSLFEQFDLFRAHSYNPRLSDLKMRLFRLAAVSAFHFTAWCFHPSLIWNNLRNVALNTPRNRAEKAAAEILRRLPSAFTQRR